jgi:WD40 repeat protein
MARVFISHSSRDSEAASWVAEWLHANGFDAPFLDFDKHSGIPPGADWERTLYREIASSQALLIIQTGNWNTSKWCFAEFAQARALGKPIFQLIGVPTTKESEDSAALAPISSDLQHLDLRDDRENALLSLSNQLTALALGDRGGFYWDSSRPPYPGLLCFNQEDAAIYFGRDEEVRTLNEQLQVLRIHGSGHLMVILGASGSGKSSLLRAGVLPRLSRSGRYWIPLAPFRPQKTPCKALSQVFALAFHDACDWRELHDQLLAAESENSLATVLTELAADIRLSKQLPDAQILISIDQAEELFSEADQDEMRIFFRLISTALAHTSCFQVMMTLRSDFLGCLQAAPGLSVPLQEFSLPPLPSERLAEIITGPARVAGIQVEDAFVRAAINDANTDDALPLLAFALREIYDRNGADCVLSLADYESFGDLQGNLTPLENAVRCAADNVLQMCHPSESQMTALRDAFIPAMVRINDQDDYTRRAAKWADLPPQSWPLLTHLVEARLLIIEQREDDRWIEVAHEALLRKWPLLRQWLDEAREFLVGTQQLEPELIDWQRAMSNTKDAHLLTGLKLTRAHTWLQERPQQISSDLRAYIEQSLRHQDRLARRQQNNRRLIFGGLTMLTSAACAAWFWGHLRNLAAYEAQTRQFQSTHLSMLEIDPVQSLVYGLAAMARIKYHTNESLPLAISLDRAADLNRFRGRFLSGQDEVWSLAETPSGHIISGGRDGSLHFWNKDDDRASTMIMTDHSAGVRGLVAISDHEWWTAGDDGRLQHWIHGRRYGAAIITGHGSIQTLIQTSDGNLLTAGTDGQLRLWDSRTGKSLRDPLRSGHLEVWSLARLPNGDWVTGGREGLLQWWRNGKRVGDPIVSGQGAVSALVALPNNQLISGGDDGSIRLWSETRQSIGMIKSGHSSIFALIRRNSGLILSGGSERLMETQGNYIRVWDMKERNNMDNIIPGQIESLSIVQLCNGDLISGGSDGYLHYWRDIKKLSHPTKTVHPRVYALSLLPSGDLVSGGDDDTFQVWRSGQAVARVSAGQRGVTSLATLPDGTLLSGGRDGSVRAWSIKEKIVIPTDRFQTRHGAVWAIASLPDGDLLTGGDDGLLRRWRHSRQVGTTIKTPHTTVVSLVIRRNGDWVSGGSSGDLQIWRNSQPLGDYFQVASGSVWSLLENRQGELMSANGDGTLFVYPSASRAIQKACLQLKGSRMLVDPDEPAEYEAIRLCSSL